MFAWNDYEKKSAIFNFVCRVCKGARPHITIDFIENYKLFCYKHICTHVDACTPSHKREEEEEKKKIYCKDIFVSIWFFFRVFILWMRNFFFTSSDLESMNLNEKRVLTFILNTFIYTKVIALSRAILTLTVWLRAAFFFSSL